MIECHPDVVKFHTMAKQVDGVDDRLESLETNMSKMFKTFLEPENYNV